MKKLFSFFISCFFSGPCTLCFILYTIYKKYTLVCKRKSCLHLHNNFIRIVLYIFCFIGSSLILGYKRSNASGTLKYERTQHERPHILDQEFDTYLRFVS